MLEFFGAEYAAQAAGGLASASSTSAQLQQEQQANGRGSPGGSVAGDAAPRLTHVDASGRAAMVDVSDVSLCAPGLCTDGTALGCG